jgi:RHS repeat-associated protein
VTSQSVNGSNTINYAYDNDGLLTAAGSLTLTPNPQNGLLIGTTLGQVSDSWNYNSFGEPSSYSANINGSTVFSVTYTRDKLGRISEKSESVNGNTVVYHYDYDDIGRLTDVKQDGVLTAHYEYDANGNRTRAQYPVSAVDISGSYDDQDRLLSYGPNTYNYTANGELFSKTNASGTAGFSYDVLGNLRATTLVDGTSIEYVIDAQDRRVGKKINGTLTQGFLYDGQLQIVAELDGPGNVVSRFVYGDRSNVPSYMIKGGITYRIIADHLGSPRIVVNTTDGTIIQRMDYDEFGNAIYDTNPGFQPFGFAGGLHDQHTGLIRFGARDYDSESGRWTSKDPILFSGKDTNLYAYSIADPINTTDTNGMVSDAVRNWTFAGASIGSGLGFLAGGGLGLLTGPGAVAASPAAAMAGVAAGAAIGAASGAMVGEGIDRIIDYFSKSGEQRKPGSRGQFKSCDALRAENRMARDAAREAGLNRDQQQILHKALQGQDLSYSDILGLAKMIKNGTYF